MTGKTATPLISGFGAALGTELFHAFRYGIDDVDPARGLFVGAFVAVLTLILSRLGGRATSEAGAARE